MTDLSLTGKDVLSVNKNHSMKHVGELGPLKAVSGQLPSSWHISHQERIAGSIGGF